MAEKICRGEHACHLCVLASLEKIEEIKELTKHPRFICFICGRVADSEKNLCNPMSLHD
jgi:hypothetical protein